MMTATQRFLSVGEAAQRLGYQWWHVDRVIRRGLVPQPGRVCRTRILSEEDLPALRQALVAAGYRRGDEHGQE